MAVQAIDVSRLIEAPRGEVWALLEDVTTWSRWGPFDRSELERPGTTRANGVGAVRFFQTGSRQTRERITICDEPRTLAYVLLDGVPVRDYRAVVSLEEVPGGTVVSWSSRFRSKIPGTGGIVRKKLEQFIVLLLDDLSRALTSPVTPSVIGAQGRPARRAHGEQTR